MSLRQDGLQRGTILPSNFSLLLMRTTYDLLYLMIYTFIHTVYVYSGLLGNGHTSPQRTIWNDFFCCAHSGKRKEVGTVVYCCGNGTK